ncbi:MarR family transcriptional regulator [Kitasatospora sp. NBC_00240]|uniref:GbsR/MarR family transcriptional regulator n=1 Tax=Kitasatospora sp. NBC_00240 TaxID=2903567 RepID=UPI00225B442B|nr:MarR family transcriptional regulator [Kitasatospora sp. NBC_00240]MCX5210234.1 MarR family transcriptional regulator [Kitasatospora sp. NBC_00240]
MITEQAGDDAVERDTEAVTAFIERFAGVLGESGFPRMPARIFTALLATDNGRLTAAELAEGLQISPAAVSGAVRYLTQVNLVGREREAGSRRDRYRLHNDVWYEALVRRDQMLVRWEDSLREGVTALGPDSPAGARMAESLAFFEFVREELPGLLSRWHGKRAELREAGGR